jgi:anti-sigma regulatory factor (Ser/Thr protein kinase)
MTCTLRSARNDVTGWLDERGMGQDLRDRAALVVSELATNAVQAAPGTAYSVRVWFADGGSINVAVTSHTANDRPPPRGEWRPSNMLALRGRGLLIVGELAHHVAVDQPAPETFVVTATLR